MQDGVDQVVQRGLVPGEYPVGQQVACLDDRAVEVHPGCHGQSFAGLLVGTGDPVGTRVRTTDRDPPGGSTPQAAELAVHGLAEAAGRR